VRDIISHAFDRAVDILKSRRADLDRGAEILLTRETLSAEDFPAIRPAKSEQHEAAPQHAPTATLVS
jgi:cell division protease FtsH